MRFPADANFRLLLLGLSTALAGCGLVSGGDGIASAASPAVRSQALGPAADYPMVLGEPLTIEGETYTPADTMNYDAVGYASVDDAPGITAANRTLPLPSYAEVTSLETGKTILVRIERRGPMTGTNLVSLSVAAAAQLGTADGAPVRVRRVNPPEAERAELRAGRAAPERMDTPKGLVEVLRRKLPATGTMPLGTPTVAVRAAAAPHTAPEPGAAATSQPLPRLAKPLSPPQVAAPARTAAPDRADPVENAKPTRAAVIPAKGTFAIQAGAFSSRANAERAAKALDGFVRSAGKFFRVRTGPFGSTTQANAALAKVRAAGYSDARVITAD